MKEVAENFSQSHHKKQCAEYTALVPSHKTVHLFHLMKEENSMFYFSYSSLYRCCLLYMHFCMIATPQVKVYHPLDSPLAWNLDYMKEGGILPQLIRLLGCNYSSNGNSGKY